jgi:hypothetical protein
MAAAASTGTTTSSDPFPPATPVGAFPIPAAPYQPTAPVGPYQPIACPSYAPGGPSYAPGDDTINSLQITVDTANAIAADVPDTVTVVIAGEGTQFPDPAKYVAEAVAQAGQIALDIATYEQTLAGDCDVANQDGVLANIDNTTVNTYNLLSAMETTLGQVQDSVDTVGQQVAVAQQTVDDELTLGIEQALTAPAGSPPNAAYELPARLGGNLDSTPVGVQQVVTTTLAAAQASGLPVDAAATAALDQANADLAAGNDAGAYAEFATAYRDAAQ